MASFAEGCLNSFTPTTLVLMADGTTKPIKDIKVGERVKATDPTTGKTAGEPVTKLHNNQDNAFTDVTVATTDGPAVLHTTQEHPFWNAGTHHWESAARLVPGSLLIDDAGLTIKVMAVHNWSGLHAMRNLTVSQLHTFYVMAGKTPVLVHNTAPCMPDIGALSAAGKIPDKGGLTRAGFSYQKHMGRGQLPLVDGAELDSAGQQLLDSILTDPNADFQLTGAGGYRVISNDIVSPWKGSGAGNDYFVGATFDSAGNLDYFGVYR
jgi:hypothetical protein